MEKEKQRQLAELLSKIKKGKIINTEELDKNLSKIGFMRVPLVGWKESRKDLVEYYSNQKKFLKSKAEGFILFLLGIIAGSAGSIYYLGKLNWISIIISLMAGLWGWNFIYNINKRINGVSLLEKDLAPYILIYGNHELRKKLIKDSQMEEGPINDDYGH